MAREDSPLVEKWSPRAPWRTWGGGRIWGLEKGSAVTKEFNDPLIGTAEEKETPKRSDPDLTERVRREGDGQRRKEVL